ncbi:MAG: response regulator [SAR324 cluster bacterium]|nr:response regulator [SAR324 cluster bacterium]
MKSISGQILVVDDNPMIHLQVLKAMRTVDGVSIELIKANNGMEALTILEKNKEVDLILTDLDMPEMDGFELIELIRKQKDFGQVPILFLSSYQELNHKIRAFELGATDYITKPFIAQEFQARVMGNIQRYQQQRQIQAELQASLLIQQEKLVKRQQIELDLQIAQKRLAIILDFMDDALIMVDDSARIIFFNRGAERILGYSAQSVSGKMAHEFIPLETIRKSALQVGLHENFSSKSAQTIVPVEMALNREDQTEIQTEAMALQLISEEEKTIAVFFREKISGTVQFSSSQPITSTTGLIGVVGHEQQRIQAMEDAVEGIFDWILQGRDKLLDELRNTGSSLQNISDYLSEEYQSTAVRETLVQVMVQSIQYWEKTTGKTRIELAEESGLWRIYIDRDHYQSKTMDRYLKVHTLPKFPRWKNVVETANFVLTRCPQLEPQRTHLQTTTSNLKKLLQNAP